MNLQHLQEPFSADKVHWRIGSTTQAKDKGMALAYIDARDVMERLDEVCGPENWQCRYPHATNKTCCDIAIKINDEWVWKSNGAGDTDVEGDKGAFSDAFKRAAVLWGIGRYLYDLGNVWVAIEARGRSFVINQSEIPKLQQTLPKPKAGKNNGEARGPLSLAELKKQIQSFCGELPECTDEGMLLPFLDTHKALLEQCERDLSGWWNTKSGGDSEGIADRIETQKRLAHSNGTAA